MAVAPSSCPQPQVCYATENSVSPLMMLTAGTSSSQTDSNTRPAELELHKLPQKVTTDTTALQCSKGGVTRTTWLVVKIE